MRKTNATASVGITAIFAAGAGILLWTHQLAGARSDARPFQKPDRQPALLQQKQTAAIQGSETDLNQDEQPGVRNTSARQLAPVRTISAALAMPPLPSRVMPTAASTTDRARPNPLEELRPPPRAPSKTLPAAARDEDASERPS